MFLNPLHFCLQLLNKADQIFLDIAHKAFCCLSWRLWYILWHPKANALFPKPKAANILLIAQRFLIRRLISTVLIVESSEICMHSFMYHLRLFDAWKLEFPEHYLAVRWYWMLKTHLWRASTVPSLWLHFLHWFCFDNQSLSQTNTFITYTSHLYIFCRLEFLERRVVIHSLALLSGLSFPRYKNLETHWIYRVSEFQAHAQRYAPRNKSSSLSQFSILISEYAARIE